MHDRTTTVLTIDLPGELSERLRLALRRGTPDGGRRSMRGIALEALTTWLEEDEKRVPTTDGPPGA